MVGTFHISNQEWDAVIERMKRDNIINPSNNAVADYLLYKAGILDKWPESCKQGIPGAVV